MESSCAYSLKSGRDQEFFFFHFCQVGGHPIIVHNRDGPNLARGQTPNTIFFRILLCSQRKKKSKQNFFHKQQME
jgi:hypothetical protein